MDKSLAVAAAKQELHVALDSKDEQLIKAGERIKELDAENEALKRNISQGCCLLSVIVIYLPISLKNCMKA